MITRPYPERDGLRVWLSRSDRRDLLDVVDNPRRELALLLGLHGLRTDEIVGGDRRGIVADDVRQLDGADGSVLIIQDGKTGKRETPISDELAQKIRYLADARQLRKDDQLLDVSTRTLRNWIEDAREELVDDLGDDVLELGMHDLRRSWATDVYYSLAFAGVPIAETLTLSWGGWTQSTTGRETFRQNYLGPVPDHITEKALESLDLSI